MMTRNLHSEAAGQIAWARNILSLIKMGAYSGTTAEQMKANAEFLLSSAGYKASVATASPIPGQ